MNIFNQFESKKGQILQSLRKFGGKIKRGSKCKLEHYIKNQNKLDGTFKKREQALTAALRKQFAESQEMARKE